MAKHWSTWRRFFLVLWVERTRLLTSLFGALLLWFLLGQKVNDTKTLTVVVKIVQEGDRVPQGSGLFVRIPEGLAFSGVTPTSLKLQVSGPAENVARLEGTVRGFYQVRDDYLGEEDEKTRDLDVNNEFDFPVRGTLGLKVEALDDRDKKISLTMAVRTEFSLPLTAENLEFVGDLSAEGVEVEFNPSIIKVSGPKKTGQLLQLNPQLFKLTTIEPTAYDVALRGNLTVRSNHGRFADDGGQLRNLELENELITITFRRQQALREVKLPNVEVLPLIPRDAHRAEANADNPLRFDPESVTVNLNVPEQYFDDGGSVLDLKKNLNLFVDLGDMPFGTDAKKIRPHLEGLPEGSEFTVVPPLIDVTWNIPVATPANTPETDPK